MGAASNTDAFWQNVINSIADPVFVKDQEHRWIAFNDAFCSFMGYERDELLGKSDYDFFPKSEADEFWSVDEEVFASGRENENEELLTDASGRTHVIATKKAVFRTHLGEKVLVGVIRDISARKKAQIELERLNQTLEDKVEMRTVELEERARRLASSEKALREQTNLLESILYSLGDGVVVLDSNGHLLLENPVVEKLVGRPPVGVPFWSWLGERVSGAAKSLFSGPYRAESLEIEEMMFSEEATGHVVWLAVTSRPLKDEDAGVRGSVVVLRDVTARRKAERELRMSEQRFFESQKMEAIGQLAGGIAHDFNNLLLVIQGCASVLDRELLPDSSCRQELTQINKAVERAASLTRQLLAFGRRQVVTPCLLDVGGIVLDMEGMLRRVIGEHIDLHCHVASNLPLTLVDRAQMEQVLMNLVINARDAMPSGGRLDVSVERLGMGSGLGQVVLGVADTGEGMDEQTRLRAFEPFFTTKKMGGGSGLGLATVYGIVRASGGYVTVESRPKEGSFFRVFLPAKEERVESVSSSSKQDDLDLRGDESILLVEDDDSIRDLLRRVLEEKGYRVITCSDGQEALAISQRHDGPIDLLLTDVIMPGLSGPRVARILREKYPSVHVVFMSGYSDDELARYDAPEGHLKFFQKPFCMDSLLREIRMLLNRAA